MLNPNVKLSYNFGFNLDSTILVYACFVACIILVKVGTISFLSF